MLNGPYNIIGLIILVLDLVAIIGVIGGRSSFERKALWTLLILFLPLLGMILYYAIGKSRQDASLRAERAHLGVRYTSQAK